MPETLTIHAPYDRRNIGNVTLLSDAEIEQKLEVALVRFRNRKGWMQPFERIAILQKLAELVELEKSHFAELIAQEGGKPLIDARAEVARAIDGISLAVRELQHLKGEQIPMGLTKAGSHKMAFTFREPIGVVVAISAFNHPLNLIIHQVIPAIATGCPILIKPASTTPFSCIKLVELLHKAGLPDGWVQVLLCDTAQAEKLATDPRIAYLSFIGSAKVGWHLRSKLAPGTRCGLEHGGVAPVIIDETVDVDAISPALLKGGFYHAGQVCVSVQRIFIAEKIARNFAEYYASLAAALRVGDPEKDSTEVGPLILPKEVDRIENWVKEAVKEGAEILCGGKRISDTCYAPTVLYNPSPKSKVMQEEVFGPVVCVSAYKERADAIALANSVPYAFQAAVFTRDIAVAMECVQHLNASAVMVNEHTAFRVDWMPFGGFQHSGLGTGGIGYTMREYTQEKMMVLKL